MIHTGKPLRSKSGFADLYLERYGSGSCQELPAPDPDLFLIVTIPAFKEPKLTESLNALLRCEVPAVKWEIIVNVNYPENADQEAVQVCRESFESANKLAQSLDRRDVRIYCLWNPDVPKKLAGVGLARKVVMDLAVSRFNQLGCKDGIIAAFDADSICESGYLRTLVNFFRYHTSALTANIYFEHPVSGPGDSRIYHSITEYELYLRYVRLAIGLTGHPHAIHTVGSSFSVRAKAYVRVNGMGRQKAGEDFYFLHKCAAIGKFWEINSTAVFPSSRESDRVSFGTGATMIRQLKEGGCLDVYHDSSFEPLTALFFQIPGYWNDQNPVRLMDKWNEISPALCRFLDTQQASSRIMMMRAHSASLDSFKAKFYGWFNGFMILRYLNEMHRMVYNKIPVLTAAGNLAGKLGIEPATTTLQMLRNYRNYERAMGNRKVI